MKPEKRVLALLLAALLLVSALPVFAAAEEEPAEALPPEETVVVSSVDDLPEYESYSGSLPAEEPASSGTTTNGFKWTCTGGILTISGNGSIQYQDTAPWASLSYTQLVFESGITGLAYSVFHDKPTLTKITIPDTLISFWPSTFANNTALEEFVVDANNSAYCALDGVLFSKDMKTLWSMPCARTGSGGTRE